MRQSGGRAELEIEGVIITEWSNSYFPAEDSILLLKSIGRGGGLFADVGTGSGIIGIAAALKGYDVVAADTDPAALEDARANADANGADIAHVRCNLLDAFRCRFSLIAFNPPYLPDGDHPDRQLTGGPSGVEISLRLLESAERLLEQDGAVLLVASSLGDTAMLKEKASAWSFEECAGLSLDFERLTLYRCRLRGRRGASSPRR